MNGRPLRAEDPGGQAELPPAWPRLGEIAVSTLIRVGRLDAEEILAVDEQAAPLIAGARLRWLDGVAHVPHFEGDPTTLDELAASWTEWASRSGAGALRPQRPGAFALAHRMLDSASEAEDLVQEGLLRLHRALEDGERLESPRAYLSTVVTRLAIDELRSARVRRETYVGEWLPEPLVGMWRTGGRATRRPSGAARSWRSASSPPPARAILRRSSPCSPRTSRCTTSAAAGRRPLPAPCIGRRRGGADARQLDHDVRFVDAPGVMERHAATRPWVGWHFAARASFRAELRKSQGILPSPS
jgi:hypothetical protein